MNTVLVKFLDINFVDRALLLVYTFLFLKITCVWFGSFILPQNNLLISDIDNGNAECIRIHSTGFTRT